MNLNDIATQLLFTTVPIKGTMPNGAIKTGTGFRKYYFWLYRI